MATLAQIYPEIKQICLKDEQGVYLNGEKVALDNTCNNGYIRRNGSRSLTPIGSPCSGDFDNDLPLKFVGAVPKGDPLKVEQATIAALAGEGYTITDVEIQKDVIAESESIALEELTKFDGVALIMVDFTASGHFIADPNCDYDLC